MHRRKFMSAGMGSLALASGIVPAFAIERGSSPHARLSLYRGADLVFGTTVAIQVLHDSEPEARRAIREAFEQARKIDRLMSIYREGSQVHALNSTGRIANPDPHLLAVVREAQSLSALTDGAFDITVQPLWLAASTGRNPDAARSRVGWRGLHAGSGELKFLRPGMAITLNGIAQGYATDLALNALRVRGIRNALVDIGELAAAGHRPESGAWQAGIANPRHAAEALHVVPLDHRCLACSGDYENVFSEDFSRHHIFDPATGRSPAGLSAVAVAAPTAMLADGLSTALMVMGQAKGMQLVYRLKGVDALFIDKAGRSVWTAGFPLA